MSRATKPIGVPLTHFKGTIQLLVLLNLTHYVCNYQNLYLMASLLIEPHFKYMIHCPLVRTQTMYATCRGESNPIHVFMSSVLQGLSDRFQRMALGLVAWQLKSECAR